MPQVLSTQFEGPASCPCVPTESCEAEGREAPKGRPQSNSSMACVPPPWSPGRGEKSHRGEEDDDRQMVRSGFQKLGNSPI